MLKCIYQLFCGTCGAYVQVTTANPWSFYFLKHYLAKTNPDWHVYQNGKQSFVVRCPKHSKKKENHGN